MRTKIIAKTLVSGKTDVKELYKTLREEEILTYPAENFGRFDLTSRKVLCVTALALHKAGWKYSRLDKQDTGLILAGDEASLKANEDYFRDYADNGRKLGRGGLFIYTLPTSPLAETAIYCGFTGPLLYVYLGKNSAQKLVQYAGTMIADKMVKKIVAVQIDRQSARAFAIQ
jgi:hypothetical protein